MIHQKEGGQVGKTISHYKIFKKLDEGRNPDSTGSRRKKIKRTY